MKCANCKMTIHGPKIVVNDTYWCSTCIYFKDMKRQNPNTPEKRP